MPERVQAVDGPSHPDHEHDHRGRLVEPRRRLVVGAADDPAEREADVVAAQVRARLHDRRAGDVGIRGSGPSRIRRAAVVVSGRRADESTSQRSRIHRAATADVAAGGEVTAHGEDVLHRVAREEAAGASAVRRRMEPAFGADFGNVRIHTGSDVDVAAAGMQAHAFTIGRDVYIRRDDYRPGTAAGDELIAHELTHTLQQGSARARRTRVDPTGATAPVDEVLVPAQSDAADAPADVPSPTRIRRSSAGVLEHTSTVAPVARVGARWSRTIARTTTAPQPGPLGGPIEIGQQRTDPVVQRVRSVAQFQAQTPGTLTNRRRTVTAIDDALGDYIAAPGPQKLTQANALLAAINHYLTTPNHDAARIAVVTSLQTEVTAERGLLAALGAPNGALLDHLVAAAPPKGGLAALAAVATALTPAHAPVLPGLVDRTPSVGGGFASLLAAVNAIQPANAFLLTGLVDRAGGPASLDAVTDLIVHIQPTNAWMLVRLLDLVPNSAHLDALVQEAGAAHAGRLEQMVIDAGGAANVQHLTASIHLKPGRGDLGAALAARAAGDAARFVQLASNLTNFHRAPAPAASPIGVVGHVIDTAVLAYNTPPIQLNKRIREVSVQHFLERHTMHFFDFAGIIPRNDLWPFLGVGAQAQVEDLVAQALTQIRTGGGLLSAQVPAAVAVGGFNATIGALTDGTLPNPNPPYAAVPALRVGQFFPVPGVGGVIPMSREDMLAVRDLVA